MTTDLDLTLEAARTRGWHLVLLHGKLPACRAGDPWPITQDLDRIRRHVSRFGNVGLFCGQQSGVAVGDDDWRELFEVMESELGPLGRPWVQSGGKSRHYYISWEPNLRPKLVWGGAVLGEVQRGGTSEAPCQQQVVLPPSVHPVTRRPYRWLVDPTAEPLQPIPGPWRPHLTETPRTTERTAPDVGPDDLARRQTMALRQPNARDRARYIKFACPACRAEGFDEPGDNAVLFPDGRWGCAWAAGTDRQRLHSRAIGIALGALLPGGRRA
jgi:hypothetical protein